MLWVEVLLLKPACHEEKALRPKYERSQLVAAGGAKIWSFGPSEPYTGELYTSEPYTGERPMKEDSIIWQ